MPWTHTEPLLRSKDFDLIGGKLAGRPPCLPASGRRASSSWPSPATPRAFDPDGAVLEFGIGTLPDAVCGALGRHEGCACTRACIGDGVVELAQRGS